MPKCLDLVIGADEPLYQIVRFYRSGRKPKVVEGGLSLAQAKDHCLDPATSRMKGDLDDWFDGFAKEGVTFHG